MASQQPSFLEPQPRYDPIIDKDKFEKELNDVINKALQPTEVPIKEKHIRSAIISTWREKGCNTLWKCIRNHPLDRASVVCYKSCYLIHKMLRDGYPDNIKKSATHAKFISELAKHWNHLGDGVSKMITAYLKILWNKIAFHVKNPDIPASLNFIEKPFVVPSDIDYVFQMSVEVFDYQSAILHYYAAVLATLDSSYGVSANQMQCRIAPFIPAIKESAALYDLVFKLMKALHTSLPADTLGGHRERFNRQYHALRKYFLEAGRMAYIKKFVEIPELPPDPPNFLIGTYTDLELSQMIITHSPSEDSFRQRTDTFDGTLIDLGPSHSTTEQTDRTPPLPPRTNNGEEADSRFLTVFGNQEFDPFVNETPPLPQIDERDVLIEQLMREIVELKDRIRELEEQNEANQELIGSLRQQLEERDAEIADYKQVAEQACNENVMLKQQIEVEKVTAGNHAQADERLKAAELKFGQLREVYQKLRNEHIQVLRSSGEVQKKLNKTEKDLLNEENLRLDLERSVSSLTVQLDDAKQQASEESAQLSLLRQSLSAKEIEASQLKQSTASLQEQLLQSEQSSLHSSVDHAIEQAQAIIRKILEELDDPSLVGLTCTPAHLLTRTISAQSTINTLTSSFLNYNKDPSALGPALASVSSFTQSMSEVILFGAAAGHMASADKEKRLTDFSKSVGRNSLQLLNLFKGESYNPDQVNTLASQLLDSIQQLSKEAEELKKINAAQEEANAPLGDVVEEEMASTSLAVDEAARRIEEILRRSREEHTGVNLEVNSRILGSCTDLMKAIQILIQRSKELQQEIVSEGMGSMHDVKDFYKKHHTWSEGLISAAKQVGHGASLVVDSADKVVSGNGKFEELIVTSREVAASTAQLVAASKVKARVRSDKLKALKASSRTVSEATGSVVASAQSGAELKAEAASKVDFSKLTLNQTKRLEMESQVRALELEKELEMERTRLAELRKLHYHKAGASEGWDEETEQI